MVSATSPRVFFAGEKKPGFHLDHGKDFNRPFGGGAETLFQQEGCKLERVVETAYRKDADGKGYVQEIKFPWALLKSYRPAVQWWNQSSVGCGCAML